MGPAAILVAASAWGLLGVFGAEAQRVGVSAWQVAWWRSMLGGVLFAGYAFGRRYVFPRGRDLAVTAAFGVVGGSVFYAAFQWAVAAGGATLAGVLLYTAPGFVAFYAVTFFGERMTPRTAVAVVVSLGGIALIGVGGGGVGVRVSVLSVGLGVFAGFTYSLYYVFGHLFFHRYEPAALFAVALPVGAVGLWPVAVPALPPAAAWPYLAGGAVVSTFVAYLAYGVGLRRVGATRASVLATFEPVVAAGAAALLLGERLAAPGLVGSAMVVAAAALLARA